MHSFALSLVSALVSACAALPAYQLGNIAGNDHVCDPIVPESCFYPFPNDFYTVEDPTSETGRRLNLQSETFPKDRAGRLIDVTDWNRLDGFSPLPSIVTFLPELSDAGLPSLLDISKSLDEDCSTVILDYETLERVPHFAELDALGESESERALYLWPAHRLQSGGRYIVAIRNLRHLSGSMLLASSAFQALRDSIPTDDSVIESMRSEYDALFSKLKQANIDVDDSLQQAWTFTVASQNALTSRILSVRDDAFSRLDSTGPTFRITNIQDNFSDHIYRKIQGEIDIPLYLNTPVAVPAARLLVDDNDRAVFNTMSTAPFEVLIPRSLLEYDSEGGVAVGVAKQGAVMQYGHGLLGSHAEIEGEYLQEIANREGYLMVGTDWWGLCQNDVPSILKMLSTDLSDFLSLTDRSTQAFTNALLAMRMMKTSFAQHDVATFGGQSVIDTSRLYYYGNSQGGIFGGMYMALTQDVTKGCLGVPGAPYSLLLPRSVDFDTYSIPMKIRYPHRLDYISLFSLLETVWVRAEPAGVMDAIVDNPLPNTPKHEIMFQYALGDAQVHTLGTYAYARTAGAVIFESQVPAKYAKADGSVHEERMYGFETVADDAVVTGRPVMIGWDFSVAAVPLGNVPPSHENDTHGMTRKRPEAQAMMAHFFATSQAVNPCNGPCVVSSSEP